MPAGSSAKRERQYEHIKESYEKRGQKGRAEEIAARTVNKERAEAGETKGSKRSSSSAKKSSSRPSASSGKKSSSSSSRPSASSGKSKSSSSSSSRPSANSGKSKSSSSRSSSKGSSSKASGRASASGGERTRAQLYDEAKRRDIPGRSSMNKAQLERALSR